MSRMTFGEGMNEECELISGRNREGGRERARTRKKEREPVRVTVTNEKIPLKNKESPEPSAQLSFLPPNGQDIHHKMLKF